MTKNVQPLRAVLLSLFGHLLIFQCVNITFKSLAISPEPQILFLGSILPNLEREDFSSNESLSKGDAAFPINPILVRDPTTQISQRLITAKPPLGDKRTSLTKALSKTTFEVHLKPKESSPNPKIDLGIDLTAPSYVPLKLELHDNH